MINQHTFSNKAVFLLSQLSKGQKQRLSVGIHPVYIAYLLHGMNNQGPHIVVSQQTKLLKALHQALLFFEPQQKIFQLNEENIPKSLKKSQIILSKQEQAQRMKWLAHAQKSQNSYIFLINPYSLTKSTLDPTILKQSQHIFKSRTNSPPEPI